jgi:Fur family transcriptional regulator, peroxide stress response regulator
MNPAETQEFRELCASCGITMTHQRQVLFEVLKSTPGHPSPEEVYLTVKKQIPSISLATVYKNIHLFLKSGIFREVSLHHGSLRVEMNRRPHHHLVCTACKSISDIDEDELSLTRGPGKLPGGFLAQRFSIDVVGLCAACQSKSHRS